MQKQNDIEKKIIKSFKLFEGLREKDEDQKILETMVKICENELILFLTENLAEKQVKAFEKDAKEIGVEKALPKWMAKIPMGRFRLEERLKYTIDMTLAHAIAKK